MQLNTTWLEITVYMRTVSSYALSFYKLQNVVLWSKFFVSDQKFIYIYCASHKHFVRYKKMNCIR
jgi:hypothetical protein